MLGLLKYQQNLLNVERAHKLSVSRIKQLLSILQTLNSSQDSIMNNFMPKELNNLDELQIRWKIEFIKTDTRWNKIWIALVY